MGGGCVVVRPDRCLHGGALHRITVLCRSLLGLGESALRSLAGRRRTSAVACTLQVSGLFLIGALLVMIITDRKPAAVKLRRAALMLIPASVIMALPPICTCLPAAGRPGIARRRPVGSAS